MDPPARARAHLQLSHKDIDELAKELYKEATATNRDAADSAASDREAEVRYARVHSRCCLIRARAWGGLQYAYAKKMGVPACFLRAISRYRRPASCGWRKPSNGAGRRWVRLGRKKRETKGLQAC